MAYKGGLARHEAQTTDMYVKSNLLQQSFWEKLRISFFKYVEKKKERKSGRKGKLIENLR